MMKNATIWILLVFYLSASCIGIIPVLKDVVAHLFWHHHHMEHVHHGEEGHSHVAEEIVQLLKTDRGDTKSFSVISDSKLSLSSHIGSKSIDLTSYPPTSGQLGVFPTFIFHLPEDVGLAVFPPPERG